MGSKQSKRTSSPPSQLAGGVPAQVQNFSPSQRNVSRRVSKMAGETTTFNDDDGLEVGPAAAASQPEPDPSTSAEGPVAVSTRVEYASLPRGTTQDVFGLISVQAAAEAAPGPASGAGESVDERQPMDIVCVLDVSGSMSGTKISQVQDAQRFIIGQMTPKDRMGLVAFESATRRELRLRRMDTEGQEDANVATLRLRAGGGTCIAAGLHTAISVMEQRRQRNKVSSIMLLTDGQDQRSKAELPELLERCRAAGCSLYVFGFGADHDAAMLSDIAEQAQTPFTYIEDTENIREVFAGAVGGLASMVAQGLELRVQSSVPLKAVNTPFSVRRASDTEATVTIPDLMVGECRNILVELTVPAQGEGASQTRLLEAAVRYTDLRTNCVVETEPVAMEAQRTDEPQPEVEPDEEVSAQRERFEVTRALREAATRCDDGEIEEASRVLESAQQRMRCAKKTKFSEALGQEIEDARGRMRSRSIWEQGGRAEVLDAQQMHLMERCTNMAQSSGGMKAMYIGSAQKSWIARSKRG